MVDLSVLLGSAFGVAGGVIALKSAGSSISLLQRYPKMALPRRPKPQTTLNHRNSSILGRYKGAVRHVDGSFSRIWDFPLQPTLLAADYQINHRYRALARLLALEKPAKTTISFRISTVPDKGRALALVRQAQCPVQESNQAARDLYDLELEFLNSRVRLGLYRASAAIMVVKVPTPNPGMYDGFISGVERLVDSVRKNGFAPTANHLVNGTVKQRLRRDEDAAWKNVEKVFRLFDNESPVPVNRVSARKTAETLFSGHRPTATSIPNFPEVELLDLRLQVNHDAVDFRKSYVLHAGRQPVALVSMFCPPHPSISPAITRGLMAASALTFEHTIVVEYITIDNQSRVGIVIAPKTTF